LTTVEENLVSRYRAHRQIMLMKPATWSWAANGTRQLCHRAHVIATPNSGPDLVRDCLLRHPDELAETMQVIFLVLVKSSDQNEIEAAVKKMIAKSPALQIRGHLVAKWAVHLCKVNNIFIYYKTIVNALLSIGIWITTFGSKYSASLSRIDMYSQCCY